MNKISLQLIPIYTNDPAHVRLEINGETIFDGELKDESSFDKSLHEDSINIRIKRSGRTKQIIETDPTNGFEIKQILINGVSVDPNVGFYTCADNDYVEPSTIHASKFTLNGEYYLDIPYYTLRGVITKNADRFDMTGRHNEYTFFGASMTDYDFTLGVPPMQNKKNYADLFIQHMGGENLSSSGQTNQEVFETVYRYLADNKSDIVFAQLISVVGRQIRNQQTQEIQRFSAHTNKNLEWVDDFTQSTVKSIQKQFVDLDVAPIIALQIPDYQKLIAYVKDRGSRIYFISYFRDEYDVLKEAIPEHMAPYFEIDPDSKYCGDNGYHATPEEHQNYSRNLIGFSKHHK